MKKFILIFALMLNAVWANAQIAKTDTKAMSVETFIVDDTYQPYLVGGEIANYDESFVQRKGLIISTSQDKMTITNKTKFVAVLNDSVQYFSDRVIDCSSFEYSKEQFIVPMKWLWGNTKYYVKAYAVLNDGSVIYGNEVSFVTQNYNRYNTHGAYANVWHAFDATLFDLKTDEIINPNTDGYYYSTNENPTSCKFQVGTSSYLCFKFKTKWNYKVWYSNVWWKHTSKTDPLTREDKNFPVMSYKNGYLTITPYTAGDDIYYSIDGNYFSPESFTQKYDGPIKITSPCIVCCYSINSDGMPSHTNAYQIRKTEKPNTDINEYNDIIYVRDTIVRYNDSFPLNIRMKNSTDIISFQFDLELPKGMSIAYDAEAEDYDINLSTERTTMKRHSLSYLPQEDGTMRIVCTSGTNQSFSGYDGNIVTIMVNVDKDINPGDYALYLNNIEMTTSALKSINVEQCKSTLTVKTYTLGDVNNDGNITVTDAACVVAFILGSNTDGLIREAADVNQDGNISVTDAACVVDIILHGGASAAKPEPMPKATDDTTANKLFVEDFSAKPGDQVVIPVMMDNDAEITAFQFDMYLPNGITIAEEDGEPLIDLSQSRTTYKKHSLSYLQQENGAMRIVCNSGTNKTFSGNSGEVVNVTVNIPETMAEGEYEISIKAQELTTSALQSINVDETKCKLTIETPTGITSIRNASLSDAPAYNLQGIRVNSGYKGIVIKEGRKFLK